MNDKCLYCYKPLLNGETQEFHRSCAKEMFGKEQIPFIDIGLQEIEELAKNMLNQSMSVSGVQKKMSLGLSFTPIERFTITNLNAPFILKPPTLDYPYLPEIEDLTMHLAQKLSISTAKHSLIRLKSGELAYLTRRFDRENGQKLAMEDMCQLSGKLTENKYWGSMEQIGKLVKKYATYPSVELQKLYELTLFCFLTGNSDMHLKNFSLLTKTNGQSQVILSPAYDLLATRLLISETDDKEELALTLNGKKRKLTLNDFEIFSQKRLNIDRSKQEFIHHTIGQKLPDLYPFIQQSFLPEEVKNEFIILIKERAKRLGLI